MARMALARLLLVLGVLLAALAPVVPVRAAPGERCFVETNQCVAGRFLAYWDTNGGLARNGYPLTPERREILEDGKEYTVQYFERVRMEYHPENAGTPYEVLLGQFGRTALPYLSDLLRGATILPPVEPRAGMTYFPETGHNVSPRFLAYWQANGGLARFGYPLMEEFAGNGSVQYFERGALEYHPENSDTPYEILLAAVGRIGLAEANQLRAVPEFATLYRTNPAVRARVRQVSLSPQAAATRQEGVTLAFEHGRMYFLPEMARSAANVPPLGARIYAVCDDPERGRRWFDPPDRWTPDQPVGGGAGPRPGQYIPARGFGTAWQANAELRACLGYATASTEDTVPLASLYLRTGIFLLVEIGATRWIDVLNWNTYTNGSRVYRSEYYERFPLPPNR